VILLNKGLQHNSQLHAARGSSHLQLMQCDKQVTDVQFAMTSAH